MTLGAGKIATVQMGTRNAILARRRARTQDHATDELGREAPQAEEGAAVSAMRTPPSLKGERGFLRELLCHILLAPDTDRAH